MYQRRVAVAGGAFICILLANPVCRAGEPAKMPYVDVCRMLGVDFADDKVSLPRELAFRVASNRPDVEPPDIRLTLLNGEESHEIAVAADGGVVLPVSQKWWDGNAILVANQPKGSITLHYSVPTDTEILVNPHLKDGKIDFVSLVAVAKTGSRAAMKRTKQRLGMEGDEGLPDYRHGECFVLLFTKQPSDEAIASILREDVRPDSPALGEGGREKNDEPKEIQKLGSGMFLVPVTEVLSQENPTLSLTNNPSWQCVMIAAEQVPHFTELAQRRSGKSVQSPDGRAKPK